MVRGTGLGLCVCACAFALVCLVLRAAAVWYGGFRLVLTMLVAQADSFAWHWFWCCCDGRLFAACLSAVCSRGVARHCYFALSAAIVLRSRVCQCSCPASFRAIVGCGLFLHVLVFLFVWIWKLLLPAVSFCLPAPLSIVCLLSRCCGNHGPRYCARVVSLRRQEDNNKKYIYIYCYTP